MQLLVERSQTASITSFSDQTNLKLWAMFELTPEEDSLVANYNIRSVMLIPEKPGQWQKALIWGVISAFFVTFILDRLFFTGGVHPLIVLILGIFIAIGLTFAIYYQISHFLKVNDILIGHTFTCKNVVEFMAKEDEITSLALNFRRLLEGLKNWRKREIVQLEPTLPQIEKPQ